MNDTLSETDNPEESKVYIIGCGPGGSEYLLPLALQTALSCSSLAGTARLLTLFPGFKGSFFSIEDYGLSGAFDKIEQVQGNRGILVSGSPYLFSLTRRAIARFGQEQCEIIPGISSAYVACTKTGINATGIEVLSAHASMPTYKFAEVSSLKKIAMLCGNERHHSWVQTLAFYMQATHRIIYCRDLTLEGESIKYVTAQQLPEIMRGGRELLLFISNEEHPYNLDCDFSSD